VVEEEGEIMFGQFVEIEDSSQPWAPYKIWVEHHWLDHQRPTHESVAREILKSGWMKKEEEK
jgi:hypothetical protein